jgi:hypothetical protein
MPDHEGRTKGPGTKTPDQAYKEGRAEDVQQGSRQHGDQDVTDTSTKQQHPRTPSDMGR